LPGSYLPHTAPRKKSWAVETEVTIIFNNLSSLVERSAKISLGSILIEYSKSGRYVQDGRYVSVLFCFTALTGGV
jgi:hypothetical protein